MDEQQLETGKLDRLHLGRHRISRWRPMSGWMPPEQLYACLP